MMLIAVSLRMMCAAASDSKRYYSYHIISIHREMGQRNNLRCLPRINSTETNGRR